MKYAVVVRLEDGQDAEKIAELMRQNLRHVDMEIREGEIHLIVTDYTATGLCVLKKTEEQLTLLAWKKVARSFLLPCDYVAYVGKKWGEDKGRLLGAAFPTLKRWREANYVLPVDTARARKYVRFTQLSDSAQADILHLWRLCYTIVLTTNRPEPLEMDRILYMATVLCEELGVPRPLIWPTLIDVEEKYPKLFAEAWVQREEAICSA